MSRKSSKLLKILISLVLTVSLFLPVTSTIAYADSSIYSNASEWAKVEIENANNSGVLPPMLKGKDMTKSATREELCELAVLLYEKLNGGSVQTSGINPFTDTSNIQIIKAYDLGITTGITSTSFAPNAITNREQVATMFGRAIQKLYPNMDYSEIGAPTFTDKADISSWALPHVQYLSKEGIIKGDAGKFMPKAITDEQKQKGYGTTTREQAIAITVRVNSRYQGSDPSTKVPPIINKLALISAISGANTNKDTAVVNTDSANAAIGTDWVPQAVMNSYIEAIALAQTVVDDTDVTQVEVNEGVADLATATATFNSAKKSGTKTVGAGISPGAILPGGKIPEVILPGGKIPEIGISPGTGIDPGMHIVPGLEMTEDEAFYAGFERTGSNITGYHGSKKDIEIPSKIAGTIITTIWDKAFYKKGLTSVKIPYTVTTIKYGAFAANNLTKVTIGSSVKTIGEQAFIGNQLTTVTIPNSVKTIGFMAFQHNPITSVIIGNSVTEIETFAFYENKLTTLTIPNSVTTIGKGAFLGNKLTSLTIGKSVTTIGAGAFSSNLLTSVVIPNSLTIIGEDLFHNNKLTSITIPDSVKAIGNSAFRQNLLTSVTLPKSIEIIGTDAFSKNGPKQNSTTMDYPPYEGVWILDKNPPEGFPPQWYKKQ